jgi:hypothetical protein
MTNFTLQINNHAHRVHGMRELPTPAKAQRTQYRWPAAHTSHSVWYSKRCTLLYVSSQSNLGLLQPMPLNTKLTKKLKTTSNECALTEQT